MSFWTFITVIVIIVVSGDVLKNIIISFRVYEGKKANKKEINDLRRRLNELEKYPRQDIEKRLQAIESIVVDPEYELKIKFKKLLDEK